MSRDDGSGRRVSRGSRAGAGGRGPDDAFEREIDRELAFHIESRMDELMGAGLTEEEARERTLSEFGDLGGARAELARIDRRRFGRQRRAEWWGSLRQDALFALRTLRRSPAFTLVALATLALGIGANTAIFSAVDSVLLRPLPYPAADRLVAVWMDGQQWWGSPETYAAVRERTRTMESLAGWSGWAFTLTGDGHEAEVVEGARVSPSLFELLGAVPALGRTFTEEEARPWSGPAYAGGSAAVLSHAFWMRRFGGDPDVVGRTLTIDGMAVPVVGVLPEGFGFPSARAELWLPFAVDPATPPSAGGYLRLVGRLRQGATAEAALAEMRDVAARLRADHPDGFPERFGTAPTVLPLRHDLVGSTRESLLVLFGAVGFVLLIACANVANLFLARATGRDREMRVRAALGAGRSRLVRQALTEHVVLAAFGALLGLGLAYQGVAFLTDAVPPELGGDAAPSVDGRILAFTLVVTLLAALLSGLAPALRAAGGSADGSLAGGERGSGIGPRRRRLLESLVVGELAIAFVLVVGAGLMLQSFWRLSRQDPGFRAEGVLTFRASAPEASYPRAAERDQLVSRVIERLQSLPGVHAAGAVHLLPLGGNNWGARLEIEGRALTVGEEGPSVAWRVATHGYFATAAVPVLVGRGFTSEDRAGNPPVAVVNETLAREVFPGEDPVGQRVRTMWEGDTWVTIVGVVGDTKDVDLTGPTRPQLYRPHAQFSLAAMTYMVRTDGDPLALARPARDIVAELGPDVPVSDVRALDEVVSASISQPRILTLLLAGFGAVALLMAALGIYGVIAYAVGQRTREFGIRLALGARPADVRREVVGGGARLAALGLIIGLGGAWLLTRFLRSALYDIEANDPRTFAAVAALLAGVALLGAWVPARRAARVDPTASLSES